MNIEDAFRELVKLVRKDERVRLFLFEFEISSHRCWTKYVAQIICREKSNRSTIDHYEFFDPSAAITFKLVRTAFRPSKPWRRRR